MSDIEKGRTFNHRQGGLELEIFELQSRCANEHANAQRIIEWMNDPQRKPAIHAFTEGLDRQIAYAFEAAQVRIKELDEELRVGNMLYAKATDKINDFESKLALAMRVVEELELSGMMQMTVALALDEFRRAYPREKEWKGCEHNPDGVCYKCQLEKGERCLSDMKFSGHCNHHIPIGQPCKECGR